MVRVGSLKEEGTVNWDSLASVKVGLFERDENWGCVRDLSLRF